VTQLPAQDRCLVMGVVNVTPDSFSDGGQWYGADAAIGHGLELAAQGADIVDVGGESTRPGAQRIDETEELRRIGPVVTELVRAGLTVSIDTMRARVAELAKRVDAVVRAGVDPGHIVVDPGLGFGKRPEHNWPLLARLAELGTLAGGTFPVLVGASRKGFIGRLLAGADGTPRTLADRDQATVAITALAAAAGAWCVRVHQVPPNVDAVQVAAAWRRSR